MGEEKVVEEQVKFLLGGNDKDEAGKEKMATVASG
jgi:hypothetical protein